MVNFNKRKYPCFNGRFHEVYLCSFFNDILTVLSACEYLFLKFGILIFPYEQEMCYRKAINMSSQTLPRRCLRARVLDFP